MSRWKGTGRSTEGQQLDCRVNYVMRAGQKLEQKKGAHVCNIMYIVACVMSVLEPDASSLLF